jgi:hypothetical protein
MDLDRSLGDEERLRDLAVRWPRGGELGDAPLARRQRGDAAQGDPARPGAGGEQLVLGAGGELCGAADRGELDRLARNSSLVRHDRSSAAARREGLYGAAIPMSDGRARGSWRQEARTGTRAASCSPDTIKVPLGDRLRDGHAAGHAPRPTTDPHDGFGLSVRPTQQRRGRACRQSRRRRRSRRSRFPPVAAGFPRLPPPGQRGGWPVSLWRAVRPGRCRARS